MVVVGQVDVLGDVLQRILFCGVLDEGVVPRHAAGRDGWWQERLGSEQTTDDRSNDLQTRSTVAPNGILSSRQRTVLA